MAKKKKAKAKKKVTKKKSKKKASKIKKIGGIHTAKITRRKAKRSSPEAEWDGHPEETENIAPAEPESNEPPPFDPDFDEPEPDPTEDAFADAEQLEEFDDEEDEGYF